MKLTIQKIEEIFREADIEGLIADGAPEDEYDSEAKDNRFELIGSAGGVYSKAEASAVVRR